MRMKRLELILQQPYGVWCVRSFWSCLCCCLSSVLCRAPGACARKAPGCSWSLGALWPCPGSWKQFGMCQIWSAESEQRSPPWVALGSLQCGGDNFLSPTVLCWALPLGEGWIWALPGWHVPLGSTELSWGKLWTPRCGSFWASPVHGSYLHWEWDQPPSLPEQRLMCVRCLRARKVLQNREQVVSSCGSESGVVWDKNLSGGPQSEHLSRQHKTKQLQSWSKISWLLKPPSWGFAVGLRPNPERW